MKVCSKCGSTDNKFPKQGRQCQPCVNKNGYEQKARKWAEVREYLLKVKSNPCTDCGVRYPSYVMEFDHLPGTDKKFCVSEYLRANKNLEQVRLEVSKCELVCANCHRIRTFTRLVV